MTRSRCGVVDKSLALKTRGRRFDSRLHQSVGLDFKPWPCLHMTCWWDVKHKHNKDTDQNHSIWYIYMVHPAVTLDISDPGSE